MDLAKRLSAFILIVFISTAARAAVDAPDTSRAYPSPQRFEGSIRSFERTDEKNPPAPGGIVFVGSSSIVNWNGSIQKDFAPLPIIARGFGGSNMNDALFFVDRIVIKYRPRAVILYEGDNDINAGIAPKKIAETFKAFVAAIHKQLPETRIYVMSIKPSPSRWSLWPNSVEANSLIKAACVGNKQLTYVSIVEPMLASDGKVRTDIFRFDRLHMNAAGYGLWRDVLKPILLSKETVATASEKSPMPAEQ